LKGNRIVSSVYDPLHISLAGNGVLCDVQQFILYMSLALLLLAGALCIGVTSKSVCMLREMVFWGGIPLWLLYPDELVVVVETEVPTTCLESLVESYLST